MKRKEIDREELVGRVEMPGARDTTKLRPTLLLLALVASVPSSRLVHAKSDDCISVQVASVLRRDIVFTARSEYVLNISPVDQGKVTSFAILQPNRTFKIYAGEKVLVQAPASLLAQGGFVFVIVPKTMSFDDNQAFGLTGESVQLCADR